MEMKSKLQGLLSTDNWPRTLLAFLIGWVLLFDLVGGVIFPIIYGQGCGWFAIPSILVSAYALFHFIKWIKEW